MPTCSTHGRTLAFGPRDNGWTTALGDLAQTMVTGLSGVPEDFLYLPNLGALVTGWDDTDYAIPDGGMVEGFGEWGADLQGGPPIGNCR
jgi:hypothetical protein